MSDWERGARNAVKARFPGILLRGCHFHYSQSVWRKIQRLGLSNAYHSNSDFKTAVRCFMALPFLPEDQIRPIYDHLNLEDVILNTENMNNFTIFKNTSESNGLMAFLATNSLFLTVNSERTMERRTAMVDLKRIS